MKVQQYNMYTPNYYNKKTDVVLNGNNFSVNNIMNNDHIVNQNQTQSKVIPSLKVNHYLSTNNIKDAKIQNSNTDKDAEALDQLTELDVFAKNSMSRLENYLKEIGFEGSIIEQYSELIPQQYSIFKVQSNNDKNKSLCIVELENGEYITGEHSSDLNDLSSLFTKFQSKNIMHNNKLDVEKLKEMFLDFFKQNNIKKI